MKKIIQLSILTAVVMLYSCTGNNQSQNGTNDSLKKGNTAGTDSTRTSNHYICPMHPDQKSDKPGKCGVCGMDLEVQS